MRVKPVLFLLVYGILLVVLGATASGLAAVVSANAQTMILRSSVNTDAALVRSFVNLAGLSPADLDSGTLTPSRAAALQAGLGVLIDSGQLVRVALLTPEGNVLAGVGAQPTGSTLGTSASMSAAVDGKTVSAEIVPEPGTVSSAATSQTMIIRELLPIILAGQVQAVVELWRDATPLLDQLDQSRFMVVAVTLCGGLICAALLFLVFRAAQGRLTRQSVALIEAARQDQLTGGPNHGSVVEELAGMVSRASAERTSIGVALVDIDNFRLLNNTHGHDAGDQVIRSIFRLLQAWIPPDTVLGRYGPDEFLLVTSGRHALQLPAAMQSARAAGAELTFNFGASERLPVSISAGICYYPVNGESATSLLSVAASTLDEAKVSGGDTIRVAEASAGSSRTTQTFDILQGLVIAVDTKDHYTRHHSEDVARYVDFIADRMQLDRETRAALWTAGLLHDIGKIGIPDVILRKPGRLTAQEQDVIQQHVALGDLIVRDLPNLGVVRAGIKYHHERWDGDGYLSGLAGEEIPLVARILAVGDMFSAMTTTRSYRKSMPVEEALARMGDAAGTQLDEDLVKVFLDGFASAEHPPMPAEAASAQRWTLQPSAA